MRNQPLVLVVDDDRDNREAYAQYLGWVGFEVTEAANGAEAVDRARIVHPDVVIMDLALPIIDGWTATRLLKADVQTTDIPIIALSACVFPSDVALATRSGCDRVLQKPCLPETVVQTICDVLQRGLG